MPLQTPIILTTGAVARYPLARKEMFSTRTQKFADFSRQTFAQLANPLSQWVLNLDLLQDQEVSDWRSLYRQCQGAYSPFGFVDPWDNLLQYSEQQETAPWTLSSVTAASDATVADPFALTSGRQRKLTVSATGGSILESIGILPAGSGNSRTKGLTLTASIYVQQVSGGSPNFNLVLDDGGVSESSTKAVTPTAAWQRVTVTRTFAATNAGTSVRVLLNGWSATGSVYVFGAQLEAAGIVSPYKQTGGYSGFHSKCFFQTDEFDHTVWESNLNGVQLVIEESN